VGLVDQQVQIIPVVKTEQTVDQAVVVVELNLQGQVAQEHLVKVTMVEMVIQLTEVAAAVVAQVL
jgi:hypothetical protein